MTVVNKYRHVPTSNTVYIGRGSKWGNPFVIGRDGNRDQVVDAYEEYLSQCIDSGSVSLHDLAALHGKDLMCFCAPQRCHGDVLEYAAAWAVKQLNQEERNA